MSFLNNNNDPTRTISYDYNNPSRTRIDEGSSRNHKNNSNPRRRDGTGKRKIEKKKIDEPTRTISNDFNNPSGVIINDNNSDPSRTSIDDGPSGNHENNTNPRRGGGTGKRKIEMKKIEDKTKCVVTFSKRKKGLFKKVKDLTEVCQGVKAAAITFSPMGKPYAYGNPSVDSVVKRYLDSINMKVQREEGRWWEKPIEGMNKEQLKTFKEALIMFRGNLEARVQDLEEKEAKAINFLDRIGK